MSSIKFSSKVSVKYFKNVDDSLIHNNSVAITRHNKIISDVREHDNQEGLISLSYISHRLSEMLLWYFHIIVKPYFIDLGNRNAAWVFNSDRPLYFTNNIHLYLYNPDTEDNLKAIDYRFASALRTLKGYSAFIKFNQTVFKDLEFMNELAEKRDLKLPILPIQFNNHFIKNITSEKIAYELNLLTNRKSKYGTNDILMNEVELYIPLTWGSIEPPSVLMPALNVYMNKIFNLTMLPDPKGMTLDMLNKVNKMDYNDINRILENSSFDFCLASLLQWLPSDLILTNRP